MELIQAQLDDASHRMKELEERRKDADVDDDEIDEVIEEATRRTEILKADQVSSEVVFAQAASRRSGIDIGEVLKSEKNSVFIGLPRNVVEKVDLRVGTVTTQKGSTSHVALFRDDMIL